MKRILTIAAGDSRSRACAVAAFLLFVVMLAVMA